MKRLLIFTILCIPACLYAQDDTLFSGDREPTYYYWGDEWADYILAHEDPPHSNLLLRIGLETKGAPEIARCFITKDTLKIIGLAGAIRVNEIRDIDSGATHYVVDSTVLPEYFRLFYYHGPQDTTMVTLAETRYDTCHPRYMMYVGDQPFEDHYNPYYPSDYIIKYIPAYEQVYETYFDNPIPVVDTFYVSATLNNDYTVVDSSLHHFGGYEMYIINYYHAHPRTTVYVILHPAEGNNYLFHPHVSHHLARWNHVDQWNIWDASVGEHEWTITIDSQTYICIFPILDTTSYADTTSLSWCMTPDQLRVPIPDAESSVLLWHSAGGATEWDVALCTGCTEPDDGVLYHSTTTFANLTNLAPGTLYTAWVRALCPSGDTSQWSDSLQFYVPMPADTGDTGGGSGTEVIFNVDDAYFHLSPNPTSKVVNAFSSFQIRDLDFFDMGGRLMKHEEAKALSVNVDVSDLPKGLYIVRATTVHGMAYGRLVVR